MIHSLSPEGRFAESLVRECPVGIDGHEKWLSIMRFGLGTLQKSPAFLLHLIVMRAELEYSQQSSTDKFLLLGETAAKLADELGLQLVEVKNKGVES